MPGTPVTLGPFTGGLHNSAGSGEYIDDTELFEITNLEVDTDGSLANRPAIATVTPSGLGTDPIRVIGTFLPSSGAQYIVINYGPGGVNTGLVDATSYTLVANQAIKSNCCVQFKDGIYIFPQPGSASTGGFWNTALTWTAIASIPKSDDAVLYKSRMFCVAGINSTTNTSRMYWCATNDPTTWNASDNVDVDTGNGQKLTTLTILADNLILFKEHSTYRFTYATDITKAEITKISSTIGAPSAFCTVTYDNNNVYVLHDNSVYELFNFSYSKLTANIAMPVTAGTGIFASETHSLTLFRNRLFVRYYGNMYVYSLLSGKWSSWVTLKQFSRIVVVPALDGDTAYSHGITASIQTNLYSFKDDRKLGIGSSETFTCSITTKTYDFAATYAFKVMYWWGVTIATSSDTFGMVSIPNASTNPTWDYQKANYTWDLAKTTTTWDQAQVSRVSKVIPMQLGAYARKILKFPKKVRFRQAYFQIQTIVAPNNVGDAAVRIYDAVIFVNQRETVVRSTT